MSALADTSLAGLAAAVQRMLDEGLSETGAPGAAAAVWLDGELAVMTAGVRSVDDAAPVTADTLFSIGSVTKTYVASALALLAEAGRCDLEAPVRSVIESFAVADQDVSATVTIQQLLDHTTGWPGDFAPQVRDDDDSLAHLVELVRALPQSFPPGAAYSYSNVAYNLAGRVIEVLTGAPFEDALRELIFEPFGLTASVFRARDAMARPFALGHDHGLTGPVVHAPWGVSRMDAPSGGLAQSVVDLAHWGVSHLDDPGGRVRVSDACRAMLHRPRIEADDDELCTGGFFACATDPLVLGHGGQANATFTDFGFAPDRGIAWAASANLDNCLLPTRIGDHIKATALGVSRAAREEQPWSAAEVEELGGRWVVSGLGDAIVVERDGDAVMLRVEPAVGSVLARHAIPPPLRIVRYGEDRFNTPDFLDGLLTGRVLRDPDGRAWAIRTSGRVFSRG